MFTMVIIGTLNDASRPIRMYIRMNISTPYRLMFIWQILWNEQFSCWNNDLLGHLSGWCCRDDARARHASHRLECDGKKEPRLSEATAGMKNRQDRLLIPPPVVYLPLRWPKLPR